MTTRIDRIGPFTYRQYAPSLPMLQGDTEVCVHDAVIVGGGPVGLATALGLARHGVRSVVIEADDSVCQGSRAACISRRSLEILEGLGAVDAFLEKGIAWTTGRSYYRTDQVLAFSMPHGPEQKYPPMINLQQYYIEQYLLDAIERCNAASPGMVDLRWASTVTHIDTSTSPISLTVNNSRATYRTAARWVVACDGGQSFVREALGLKLGGTGYQGRYVIIDIELPSEAPAERRAWFDPPWWPGSTILMHRQPDNIWRIDYQLRHGDNAEAALQPEAVREFVQRHLDHIGEGHLAWRPVWTSIYRAGAMTLDAYRHGHVLFAGNAAHAMPIFGVRGLNSGFDDAHNLVWKLASVIRGIAPTTLLDSYSSERIEAFHINAANAMRSTEFMSPPSRGFDLLREACLSLAVEHPTLAQLINPRQTQAIGYTDSPLSSPGDAFARGPSPGMVFEDILIGDTCENRPSTRAPVHLSDHISHTGLTLLIFHVPESVLRRLDDLLAELPWPVKRMHVCHETVPGPGRNGVCADAHGKLMHAYGAKPGSVYLLRPDGHVAGRWHTPSNDTIRVAVAAAYGVTDTTCQEPSHAI
ncbi:FAD-dependent monooxygenase [Burkholderia multivorans]|uniref:FAD-dependent monooxygenase n=1 Tax=Burkholderia multivorans TaxID=87883 RepID=UPI001C26F6C1|nr:FAD-dependent monooxygenase [Burkholderia multivorans]MBU9597070.1 FAD-dependent monooxygenase [Burkholderia multivorans]MDN7997028.1 FAD-dependent oxidoreductase [Burkholderia multivorans]WVN01568.1 FAD-dependent monooxygenase [Burkholderia multivorans]